MADVPDLFFHEQQSNNGQNDYQQLDLTSKNLAQANAIIEEAARLSHDISQPLTYLIATLEMCQIDQNVSQEDLSEMLKALLNIRKQLFHFRNLTKDAKFNTTTFQE